MEPMNDHEVESMLERVGKAVQPDPARLKAALTPVTAPVLSPLSVRFVLRSTAVAFVLVLAFVGSLGSTTPSTQPSDEYQNFSVVLADEEQGGAAELAQLDATLAAALTPEDVFTDEFLETAL